MNFGENVMPKRRQKKVPRATRQTPVCSATGALGHMEKDPESEYQKAMKRYRMRKTHFILDENFKSDKVRQFLNHNVEVFERFNERFIKKKVKDKVRVDLQCYEQDVERRRNLLRFILLEEEKFVMREIYKQPISITDRLYVNNRLRERLSILRDKREQERVTFIKTKVLTPTEYLDKDGVLSPLNVYQNIQNKEQRLIHDRQLLEKKNIAAQVAERDVMFHRMTMKLAEEMSEREKISERITQEKEMRTTAYIVQQIARAKAVKDDEEGRKLAIEDRAKLEQEIEDLDKEDKLAVLEKRRILSEMRLQDLNERRNSICKKDRARNKIQDAWSLATSMEVEQYIGITNNDKAINRDELRKYREAPFRRDYLIYLPPQEVPFDKNMTSLPIRNCREDTVGRKKKQNEYLIEQIKEKSRRLEKEREEMKEFVAQMKQTRQQEDCLLRERESNLCRQKKAYGRNLKEQAAYNERAMVSFDDSSTNIGFIVDARQRFLHNMKHPFRKAIEMIDANAYIEPPPRVRPWHYMPPEERPTTRPPKSECHHKVCQ